MARNEIAELYGVTPASNDSITINAFQAFKLWGEGFGFAFRSLVKGTTRFFFCLEKSQGNFPGGASSILVHLVHSFLRGRAGKSFSLVSGFDELFVPGHEVLLLEAENIAGM